MALTKDLKTAQEFTGISLEKQKQIESNQAKGIYSNGVSNSDIIEPVPNYAKAGCEIVNFELTGKDAAKNNCWVILGRDRSDTIDSGYGGRGDTQAAAIYICAGMSSAEPYEEQPPPIGSRDLNGLPKVSAYKRSGGSPLLADRSFHNDASLIYLSQKTDIDSMMGLGGIEFSEAENRNNYNEALTETFAGLLGISKYNVKKAVAPHAAIAIKSDNVRVVGRESIRLQIFSEKNAQGGNRDRTHGISLIGGGNPSKAQPIVLGYNLVSSFRHLKDALQTLSGAFRQFVQYQCIVNNFVASHEHVNGPLGLTDMLIPWQLIIEWTTMHIDATTLANMATFEGRLGTFLSDYTKPGDKYILSDNVFCD